MSTEQHFVDLIKEGKFNSAMQLIKDSLTEKAGISIVETKFDIAEGYGMKKKKMVKEMDDEEMYEEMDDEEMSEAMKKKKKMAEAKKKMVKEMDDEEDDLDEKNCK